MHYCFFTLGDWNKSITVTRMRELGAEMLARGVRVSYIAEEFPSYAEQFPLPAGAEVRLVPRGLSPRSILARRAAVRDLRPDFLHVVNPSLKAFFTVIGNRRVKLVGEWEEWQAHNTVNFSWPKVQLERFLDRWMRRRADVVTVVSHYLMSAFTDRGLAPTYLPYAAYMAEDVPVGPSPFAEPTAVYMGSLQPRFDQDIVFQALLLLKQQGREPAVLFIGAGPEWERWRAFVAEHDLKNVRLAGYMKPKDFWPYMRHAHVLLFPIRPNRLNEARCPAKTYAYGQAGRPIITSAVGEVPHVLGEHAQYVEPTPEAFAQAIEFSMTQQRQPDIDYRMERHTWSARAETLCARLGFQANGTGVKRP
jgi:glycosyltransferase involved in cell wall biosynthesis